MAIWIKENQGTCYFVKNEETYRTQYRTEQNEQNSENYRYIAKQLGGYCIFREAEDELDTKVAGPFDSLKTAKVTYLLMFGDA